MKSLKNRKEITVNGVKVIKPKITYQGTITKGDEESLRENRKRIINKMAEIYQSLRKDKRSKRTIKN